MDQRICADKSQSVTSVTTRVESWRSCCRQRTSRTRASCNGISIIFTQYPSQIVVMTRALEENLRRWTIEFGPHNANTSDLQDKWEWKKYHQLKLTMSKFGQGSKKVIMPIHMIWLLYGLRSKKRIGRTRTADDCRPVKNNNIFMIVPRWPKFPVAKELLVYQNRTTMFLTF